MRSWILENDYKASIVPCRKTAAQWNSQYKMSMQLSVASSNYGERNMKILEFSANLNIGGAQAVAANIAK